MRRGVGVAALAALVFLGGTACKNKSAPPEGYVDPGVAPAVDAGAPVVADMMAEVRTRARRTGLMSFTASYVRASGELDPQYGKLEVGFHAPKQAAAPPPPDDPNRPAGAPNPNARPIVNDMVDEMLRHDCTRGIFEHGVWIWTPAASCSPGRYATPTCSLADVWTRAIARGAPRDALAVIKLDAFRDDSTWHFTIEDAARSLAVDLEIPDDCGIAVEHGPAAPPPAPLPALDDAAVAEGIRAVRPALEACHATGAMAHVELDVQIARDGTVSHVLITAAPDTATGQCAAKVLGGAHFRASSSGLDTHVPLEL